MFRSYDHLQMEIYTVCPQRMLVIIVNDYGNRFNVNRLLIDTVRYFVIRLYTTRINRIITLLSLHVSALLGHHQVTNVYNYDIKYIPIQRVRCYIIGVL
jgi:hypothetical protein